MVICIWYCANKPTTKRVYPLPYSEWRLRKPLVKFTIICNGKRHCFVTATRFYYSELMRKMFVNFDDLPSAVVANIMQLVMD